MMEQELESKPNQGGLVYREGNDVIYKTYEKEAIICERTDITKLIAPNAEFVNCWRCTQLRELTAPLAKEVICGGCRSLQNLDLPFVERINCSGCVLLTALNFPVAKWVGFCSCKSVSFLNLPVAKEIYCDKNVKKFIAGKQLINFELPFTDKKKREKKVEQEQIFTLSYHIKDGKFFFPVQSEIENIALYGPLGDHHKIYYEPVPFGSGFLVFDNEECSWTLQ